MLRPLDILFIGLLLCGVAFTYKIKHDSEVAIERVAKLEKKIKKEQELIDILKADWALQTSPKRLEILVERYRDELGLEVLQSENIGGLDQVPVKVELPKLLPDTSIADLITPDRNISTGSLKGDRLKASSSKEGAQR